MAQHTKRVISDRKMDATADATASSEDEAPKAGAPTVAPTPERPKEIGGPSGPEPTRYGDWEHKGRCSDF
jgi:hypothetical protein